MSFRVFAVGREMLGNAAEFVPFQSDNSLFDADVIIFSPTFDDYRPSGYHAGKPSISETDSPKLVRDCQHWRSEIEAAVEAGKTVFVTLVRPAEVFYDTGERTHSGTGRSRVTTRHVAPTSSYSSIPVTLGGLVPRGGSEISVLADLGALAVYWSEFGPMSAYEVYFDAKGLTPLLGTKKGEKVVGGIVRRNSGGALVLLPPLKLDTSALTYTRGDATYWKKDAAVLGQRFVAALVGASKALRREGKRTPAPAWASASHYILPSEERLRADISRIDGQMAKLAEEREELQRRAEDAADLRALLFETGKPLEAALLNALRILGFTAGAYRDAESEFDAVFISPEGRFLGEAEGKDSKAVNIDKMSQLERNLQEDFAQEGVTSYAKGVLFGNGFRLQPLPDRAFPFTDKCVTAAKRLRVALVRTSDLFEPTRYLSETVDEAFAAACRQAILVTEGEVVRFPPVPRDHE